MEDSHIIAIESPNGDIHIGNSKIEKNNPYLLNSNIYNQNVENIQNIQNIQNSNRNVQTIYFDNNTLDFACRIQTQAYIIKFICSIDFVCSLINILVYYYSFYKSAISMIFSGYGYISTVNYDKFGLAVYIIYRGGEVILNMYYLTNIIFCKECYIIVNNLFDSDYNYSIYIFYEFLSILFNMYIVYYIASFHNSIPLLLNHEITSV